MLCGVRARLIFLPVVMALFISPAGASAARPGTDEETAAISAVYGFGPACSQGLISDRDSSYARWDYVFNEGCEPFGDAFAIAHLGDDGQWRDIFQTSGPGDPCPLTPLPTDVGIELRGCSRPSRQI